MKISCKLKWFFTMPSKNVFQLWNNTNKITKDRLVNYDKNDIYSIQQKPKERKACCCVELTVQHVFIMFYFKREKIQMILIKPKTWFTITIIMQLVSTWQIFPKLYWLKNCSIWRRYSLESIHYFLLPSLSSYAVNIYISIHPNMPYYIL